MKKTILSILLGALVITSAAQSWSPVRAGHVYLYYLDGHAFDSTAVTIRRDTSVQWGADTLLLLNKTAKCISSSQNTYAINQHNFLMKEILVRSNGSFVCMSPDTLLFLPYNAINVPWLFDTANAVTATITSASQQSIFASMDSVKIIMLSSGDSIVLSKNHGILIYPDNGIYYRLAGITGGNIGIQVPDVASIFDAIQPGDVLEYHRLIYHMDYPSNLIYNRTTWDYDSLISKINSGGTITLNFERRRSDTTIYQVSGPLYSYDTISWTATIVDDSTNFLNDIGSNHMSSRTELFGAYQRLLFDTSQIYSCRTVTTENRYFTGTMNPAIDTVAFSSFFAFSAQYRETYGNGIGLLGSYTRQWYGAYDHTTYDTLIYARIGNVPMGTLVVLSGIEDVIQETDRAVYPNPCSSFAILPSWTEVGGVVSIYSSTGSLYRQVIVDSSRTIDVNDLAPGFYALQFESGIVLSLVKN